MENDPAEVPVQVDTFGMLLKLQILVALGCALIILYSVQFYGTGSCIRIASIGILISGAALLVGLVSGFVFGVPRTLKPTESSVIKEESNEKDQVSTRDVETNSNLVEISDWLTKILVGVGLVELNRIPHGLHVLAQFLALGLRPTAFPEYAATSETCSIAIVVLFYGLGFLIGYIWTLLYFQSAIRRLIQENVLAKRQVREARRAERAWSGASEAESLLRDGKLEEAMRVVDEALEANPKNGKAVFIKARILKRKSQIGGRPGDKELLREALAYALRSVALSPGNGGPIYNVACYQALLGYNNDEVLANLKAAIGLRPELRSSASNDQDLENLKNDDRFRELIGLK